VTHFPYGLSKLISNARSQNKFGETPYSFLARNIVEHEKLQSTNKNYGERLKAEAAA